MKFKHIIPALTPMLILAACSNDEILLDGSNGKIDYAVMTEGNSRVIETKTAELRAFCMSAMKYDTKTKKPTDLFFEKVWISRASSTANWAAAGGDYYWGRDSLSFYGYTTSFRGKDPTKFTLSYPSDKPATTDPSTLSHYTSTKRVIEDVYTTTACYNQYDLMISSNIGVKPSAAKVPVVFKHAFACVEFQVKGTSAVQRYGIDQIKFGNYYNHGDFTFPETTTTASSTNVTRSLWKTKGELTSVYCNAGQNISFIGNATKTYPIKIMTLSETQIAKSQTAVGETAQYFFIPQALTGWDTKVQVTAAANTGCYIGVRCRITQKQTDTDKAANGADFATVLWPPTSGPTQYDSDLGKVAWLYTPFTYTFEPGKKYTIVLDITEEGYDYSGKENSFKIDYTVTVSDYTGVTETITM